MSEDGSGVLMQDGSLLSRMLNLGNSEARNNYLLTIIPNRIFSEHFSGIGKFGQAMV